MRFGRKLALQVTSDQTGAPYLSHKGMKEAINKTVRDLRLYQTREQCLENWRAGIALPEGEALPTADEMRNLEEQIKELDRELFLIVEQDLRNIFVHVRSTEARLESSFSELQETALEVGLLTDEESLKRIRQTLPFELASPMELCQRLLEFRMLQNLGGLLQSIRRLTESYHSFLDTLDEHTQYLEINVAGFRKLLKRHEKQVPQKFHASRSPCLDFHKLVTRTSRQMVSLAGQFSQILGDAVQRSRVAARSGKLADDSVEASLRLLSNLPELRTPKGLGPECQMVLQIQEKLKEPAMQAVLPSSNGQVDFLYPKPNMPNHQDPERHQHHPKHQAAASAVSHPAASSSLPVADQVPFQWPVPLPPGQQGFMPAAGMVLPGHAQQVYLQEQLAPWSFGNNGQASFAMSGYPFARQPFSLSENIKQDCTASIGAHL
eukprot:TRINITY_DN88433_c0_g1_i1.p1 TRINITY_DN88433_c0_g1~~TRINITY_DN88433_c0_g1_i1.p1  ORF type:complete len:435 (+),score=86.34 TRINITY_DN88433_c0_g1_i1:90-1394(+)